MISLICGILNMTQMTLSTKHEQTHRHKEQTSGCQGRGGRKRNGLEFGIGRCKLLLHLEWINNKVLMYSTGIYTQYVITTMEKIKKECICVYN